MRTPDTTELLQVWERGAGASPVARALLLAKAAAPDQDGAALARWSIGRRDAALLDLREALFGCELRCLTSCARCGEKIELDFRIDDIRVEHGESGVTYAAEAEGYEVRFRLPDSADLLALEGCPASGVERRLLALCVLGALANAQRVEVADLPESVVATVSHKMGEADGQAEVLLHVVCPTCSNAEPAPFDIVSHLWTELDAWARRVLLEVHALAQSYGWSEAEILRMTPARRRVYLDLTGN
jgi:hypothetical protein